MTLEERVAALEAKTQDITRHTSDVDAVPYLQVNARVGLFTNYWSNQPIGQGAALSIGTNSDRYGLYAEIDGAACPDHPSVAVFASCLAPNAQPNHAFEGTAGNGSESRGLVLSWGDRVLVFRREGMELLNDWVDFQLGKIGGVIKTLWP